MYHLEVWVNGKRCDNAEIVTMCEEEYYWDGKDYWVEPGPSLADIEAILRYVQLQFPNGWRITDGRVCAYARERRQNAKHN